jgi:hypothetical protein
MPAQTRGSKSNGIKASFASVKKRNNKNGQSITKKQARIKKVQADIAALTKEVPRSVNPQEKENLKIQLSVRKAELKELDEMDMDEDDLDAGESASAQELSQHAPEGPSSSRSSSPSKQTNKIAHHSTSLQVSPKMKRCSSIPCPD